MVVATHPATHPDTHSPTQGTLPLRPWNFGPLLIVVTSLLMWGGVFTCGEMLVEEMRAETPSPQPADTEALNLLVGG